VRANEDGLMERVTEGPEVWYALYTKHQHEKSAAARLAGRGFDVFLPLYKAVHRWKDRNQTVQLPLFPCYVFLRTALVERADILRTPGVVTIVGNGSRASTITEREIEAIRKVTNSRTDFGPHAYLKAGDRVRVTSGPLAGLEGILQKVKSRYRIVLSIELLQKAIAAEVDLSAVEPLHLPSVESTLATQLRNAKS
jgi:transcription antitermination factor NusG